LKENQKFRIRTELHAGEKKIMTKRMVKLKKETGNLQDQIADLTQKLTSSNYQIGPASRLGSETERKRDLEVEDWEENGGEGEEQEREKKGKIDSEGKGEGKEREKEGKVDQEGKGEGKEREKEERGRRSRPSSARGAQSARLYSSSPVQGILLTPRPSSLLLASITSVYTLPCSPTHPSSYPSLRSPPFSPNKRCKP
jgi:hypothetical protein